MLDNFCTGMLTTTAKIQFRKSVTALPQYCNKHFSNKENVENIIIINCKFYDFTAHYLDAQFSKKIIIQQYGNYILCLLVIKNLQVPQLIAEFHN